MNYWQNKINSITKEFIDELGDLPQPMLSIAPQNKWSIARHIRHVVKLNETYFPVFDDILANRHKQPPMAWCKPWVNLCGSIVHRAVQPSTLKRTRTFPVWEPESTVYTDQLLDFFQMHQAKLIEYYSDLTLFSGNKIVMTSPGNNKIIYTLEKALLIIPAHELRHLNQALELKKQLTSTL